MGCATVERPLVGSANRDRAVVVEPVVPLDDHAVNEERLEDNEDRRLVARLCDKWKMDRMIKRKWTEKSSKIPMIIAGQSPVGYAPTGRRHAPNESN